MKSEPLQMRILTADALAAALGDVARLRIAVFRDWPYLYDGDLGYEETYLQSYRDSADAIVVGAYDGGTLVGASTGTPMLDHADDFADALGRTGVPLDTLYYLAESVLLPRYRGRGVGHDFFDAREAHARALGFAKACFCAVTRDDAHALRPADYTPLDDFWRKRGYAPVPGAIAHFTWKDIDRPDQTAKPLQFWMRDL